MHVLASTVESPRTSRHVGFLWHRNPGQYSKRVLHGPDKRYNQHYDNLEPNSIYVKIDDDIIFIHDRAIEALVREKLERHQFIFASANVVNHALLSHVHMRIGALHHPAAVNLTAASTPEARRDAARVMARRTARHADLAYGYSSWDGCSWASARCGAATHRSLIDHYWARSLGAYDFGRWDFHALGWERWSINFFAFNTSDLVLPMEDPDDEIWISRKVPKLADWHAGAVGSALVAHYAYFTQRDALGNGTAGAAGAAGSTGTAGAAGAAGYADILQQYEHIAEEACGRAHLVPY
jgi:hypothetical protein